MVKPQAPLTGALLLLAFAGTAFSEDKYKSPVAGPYNCYVYEFRTNLQKIISYVTLNADGTYKLTHGTVAGKWSYQADSKAVTLSGGPYDGSRATFEPARGRILLIPKDLLDKDQVARNWGTHYCWMRDPVSGRSIQ